MRKSSLASIPVFTFGALQKAPRDFAPLGIESLDCGMDGIARGAITEISGARSCGKTTLALAAMAASTRRGEYCAYVDTANTLDVRSADGAGMEFSRLAWVRCDGNLRAACKVADILLHAGGFGMVCLDIANSPAMELNRIPPSYWFRFRKAVENTAAAFVVLSGQHLTGSACARAIECRRSEAIWQGRLLQGANTQAIPRKPVRSAMTFLAKAM